MTYETCNIFPGCVNRNLMYAKGESKKKKNITKN